MMGAMRFSLWCDANQSWSELLEEASQIERRGWDGVWIADHFMGSRESSPHECLAYLAALAATVPRLRVGSLVIGNAYRHPTVLANAVTTIDHISGGRVVLGLGAGWQETEHAAYGIPLLEPGPRIDRLEEACEILRRLFDGGPVDFDGDYYTLRDAFLEPRPVQEHLPLLVGGGGERRTLRVVARWADEWNTWGGPDVVRHKGAILDSWCEKLGRDPAAVTRSAQVALLLSEDEGWLARRRGTPAMRPTVVGTPDEVAEVLAGYAEVGVTEIIVPDMTFGRGSRRSDTIDLFAERVVPQLP
jgi:F420-dependent oxidoreductase-like protein